jgi:hypothetical protein
LRYEEDEDGSVLIGGHPYRTGFLKAQFTRFTNPTEAEQREMRLRGRRENVLDGGRPLYHYTTLAGFQGIVEARGLWASDSRFLNDAQEMRHGAELTASVLEYLSRKSRHPAFSQIVERVRTDILKPRAAGPLIACFSTVRDSLEQWRGYGGPGGICIGFGELFGSGRPRRAPMFYAPSMMPQRVLYRHREKCILVLSTVRRFEAEYIKDRAAMTQEWPYDHDDHYAERLGRTLLYSLVSFKNPAFEQESEARIVLYHEQAGEFGSLRFRATRLGLVPYVCTGAKLDGPVTLENVMVGPSPHQDLVATSVRTFLDHHGYQDVPVDLSSVPYRAP